MTPTSFLARSRPSKPLRALELDPGSLTPDAVGRACPQTVRLDRDRVQRIEFRGPRGHGLLGIDREFTARFELRNEPDFSLVVKYRQGHEILSLLRATYNGTFEDHRDDLRGRRARRIRP